MSCLTAFEITLVVDTVQPKPLAEEVLYFGERFLLPPKAPITRIATNEDGKVYGYLGEVKATAVRWAPTKLVNAETSEVYYYLGRVSYEGNWRDSCTQVVDIILPKKELK